VSQPALHPSPNGTHRRQQPAAAPAANGGGCGSVHARAIVILATRGLDIFLLPRLGCEDSQLDDRMIRIMIIDPRYHNVKK
jgi:hypothetical protein